MKIDVRTSTTASVIDAAEARAATRIRTSAVDDTPESVALLDEALADLRHYSEQRSTAAQALRRHGIYGPNSKRSFFADVTAWHTDTAARHRLDMSHREAAELAALEGRALATGGLGGLIVPTYLVEQTAPALRATMPTVSAISYPLPTGEDGTGGGMSVVIPKFTTGVAGASQSAENTAVSTTDPTAANVTAPVVAITAATTLSWQMLDRSGPGFDLFVYRELASALNAETERQLLAGSGASGQATGLITAAGTSSVTFTSASPTAATALPKIGAAISTSASTYLRSTPDVIVSHPRFWAWLATVGENVRPPLDWASLITGGPIASGAMPINLGAGTNETRAVVFPREAVACFVSDPVVEVAQDAAGLAAPMSATVVLRRYLAVGYVWPAAVTIVSGTGMAAVAA